MSPWQAWLRHRAQQACPHTTLRSTFYRGRGFHHCLDCDKRWSE